MNSPSLDLYLMFGLDRTSTTDELGLLILAKDATLQNTGVLTGDPRRRQLETAYAVLSDEAKRRTYDESLGASLALGWRDLEHLGNFGKLPDSQAQLPPYQPQQTYYQQPPTTAPYVEANPFTHPSNYTASVPSYQPYGMSPAPVPAQDRPSAGLRLGMMLLDGIAASVVGAVAASIVGFNDVLSWLVASAVGLAYFIGLESYTGASPVKHLFGYEVRDATSGEKPTLEQSAKRQWWRIVALIPGLGTLVAFVGMCIIGSSIKPENNYIGVHDRWAGVEVVRKPGR